MLDTARTLSPTQTGAVHALLLDTYGKRFYREKNPHNVARRFTETKAGLTRLQEHDFGQPISVLAKRLQNGNEQWHPGCTLERLRRFELTARYGRCDLMQRGFDPDLFVPEALTALSRRLRIHHCTFL